jgi:hypothetical protein
MAPVCKIKAMFIVDKVIDREYFDRNVIYMQ